MSIPKCLLFAIVMLTCVPCAQAHRLIYRPQSPIYIGPVSIEIRSGSSALPTFVYGGSVYVVGRRGLRYSVYVKNRTSQRLEVLVSVDGRDVINGQAASGYTRRGYILNPYRYVDITGFRRSKSSVAAFRFTNKRNSYASKMGGSWARIGRIQVAVFRERRALVYVPRPRPLLQPHWRRRESGGAADSLKRRSRTKRSGAGQAAPSSPKRGKSLHWRRRRYRRHHRPSLGTAYGGTIYAPVSYTTFKRATSYPSHRLTIQYNNCGGFRSRGICSETCPCYRWRFRHYRRHRRPPLKTPQTPRYAPPPPM